MKIDSSLFLPLIIVMRRSGRILINRHTICNSSIKFAEIIAPVKSGNNQANYV